MAAKDLNGLKPLVLITSSLFKQGICGLQSRGFDQLVEVGGGVGFEKKCVMIPKIILVRVLQYPLQYP